MNTHSPKVRVLVADDSIEVARRICSLLGELDFVDVVGPARDGLEAVSIFKAEPVDVVILDFSMPGASGLDVLRMIRSSGSNCLAIILTVYNDSSIEAECLLAGANYFFQKTLISDHIPDILITYRDRSPTSL